MKVQDNEVFRKRYPRNSRILRVILWKSVQFSKGNKRRKMYTLFISF